MKAILDWIEGAVNTFLFSAFLILVFLVYIYNRLTAYWSGYEIAIFCVGIIFLVGAVILLLVRGRGVDLASLFSRGSPSAASTHRLGDRWVDMINTTFVPGRRSPALPIGYDSNGGLVTVSMKNTEAHLMTVGSSGSGKSSLVNQLILAAHNSGLYQVIAISLKPGDLSPVEGLKNVHLLKYDNEWEAYARDMPLIMDSINGEIERRYARLSQLNASSIWDVRSSQRPPLLFVVIEELGVTMNRIGLDADKRARDTFATRVLDVLNIGRAAGVHILMADQGTTGNIPGGITSATVRIPFRQRGKKESYWATGVDDANAHKLRSLNQAKGIPPEVMVVGVLEDKKVEIPFFTKQDITRAINQSNQAGIAPISPPDWLYGFESPDYAHEADSAPVGTVAPPEPESAVQAHSTQDRASIYDAMEDVAQRIEALLTDHPFFQKKRTPAFTVDRDRMIAFGILAGLSENGTMRGVFNGTKPAYRERVKRVREIVYEVYGDPGLSENDKGEI